MITLSKIRDLDLSAPPASGRPLHLSAASGLVCLSSFLYVVADDEHHLAAFAATGSGPGWLIRLFEGELPPAKKERKKRKPDLEGLALLPPHGRHPHGALFAVGSGSRRNRRLGALLDLDGRGAVVGAPEIVDLAPLMAPLDDEFEALNIEGVLVSTDELRLLQRGNKRYGNNAVISFGLTGLLDALSTGRLSAIRPSRIDAVDLGAIQGIPLSFTDGALLPDGTTVFTAVAENTGNSYDDGPCAGAAIGTIDSGGVLRSLDLLSEPLKVEGLHAYLDGGTIKILAVTDADDPSVPAGLYSAAITR
jgi:hypothetical protein